MSLCTYPLLLFSLFGLSYGTAQNSILACNPHVNIVKSEWSKTCPVPVSACVSTPEHRRTIFSNSFFTHTLQHCTCVNFFSLPSHSFVSVNGEAVASRSLCYSWAREWWECSISGGNEWARVTLFSIALKCIYMWGHELWERGRATHVHCNYNELTERDMLYTFH